IDLFEEQVTSNPNSIAISMGKISLTYFELDKKVNSFSSYLTNIVGKCSVVGLLAKHSIETLIAILGILKSGNAYLPIDPDHPTERIKFMLEDSNVSCLFTNLDNIDFFQKEKTIFL
ncbi:MAG: AMP-binding protein, partial [Candidatus Sericytochromatia bacterium]